MNILIQYYSFLLHNIVTVVKPAKQNFLSLYKELWLCHFVLQTFTARLINIILKCNIFY